MVRYGSPLRASFIFHFSSTTRFMLVFVGKNAQESKPFILNGRFYECRHPMMCSESYADDFLKSTCLKETMSIIDWKGK
jgi:uracil-DNA glycosylase